MGHSWPKVSQTDTVKFGIIALLVLVVIVSVPRWRNRFLGKYAAVSLAVGWLAAMAVIVLR